MNYRLVKDYKQDDILRRSFQELALNTFSIPFEDWYQNGFWGDDYIPYSLADGDRVIANVSVNRMKFSVNGVIRNYIQLGTVMTDPAYRKQGLGRYLVETVLEEYQNKSDGIYLFANDSVLDYYPKFGFEKLKEYQYRRPVDQRHEKTLVRKVDLSNRKDFDSLMMTLKNLAVNHNLQMDNYGLYTFWLTGPLSDQIYYYSRKDVYIVADIQGDILSLNQIFAKHTVDLNEVIASFGSGIHEVVLGFMPTFVEEYTKKKHREDDCTLYVMGPDFPAFEKNYMRFPVLSHA